MAQMQKAVESIVDVKVSAVSQAVTELVARLSQAEQYIAMMARRLAEGSGSSEVRPFSVEEQRMIALHHAGIATRDEVRKHFSELAESETPIRRRRKKVEVEEVGSGE